MGFNQTQEIYINKNLGPPLWAAANRATEKLESNNQDQLRNCLFLYELFPTLLAGNQGTISLGFQREEGGGIQGGDEDQQPAKGGNYIIKTLAYFLNLFSNFLKKKISM